MAEILIHKIEFISNNPHGTYVKGDIIDVYVESTSLVTNAVLSTVGMVTYLNGVLITSGAFISIQSDVIATKKTFLSLCVGTQLLVTQIDDTFPYGYYFTYANHYSCALTPDTCDLIIVGDADVIPSSGEEIADGQITINATSSYAIEYSLDQITWQSSNVFTGLLKSTYRVYLRDTKNCQINILVDVLISEDYGPIYRLEYNDTYNLTTTKVDITKRGYVGAVTEIKGGSNGFQLMLRGDSSDKFISLMSTQGELHLTSETDQFFIDLYTNDPNLYRLNYYKDNDLKWTGKVLPFIYSEDYKSPPYYVNVTATDGLAELKDFYLLKKDGFPMYGTMSLIKIVAFCLNKLNLDLNIRVACNMYATGMATTAADDPLDQAYVDLECFYIEQKGQEVSLDFVLKSILDAFGCRIIQWEEKWHIIRVEEMTASYDWREFDYNGDYVTNGTTNPVVDIEYPTQDTVMFTSTPSFEMQPGAGTIRSDYSLGLKDNILENGDFSIEYKFVKSPTRGDGGYQPVLNKRGWTLHLSDYPLFDTFEPTSINEDGNIAWVLSNDSNILDSENAGEASIISSYYTVKMGAYNSISIKIRYNLSQSLGEEIYGNRIKGRFPYIKVRLRVKYGSRYLTSFGSWTTTDTTVDFIETKLDEWVDREVIAYQPDTGTPVDGMLFRVELFHACQTYTQFQLTADMRSFPTVSGTNYPLNIIIPTGYKTEVREVFGTTDSYILYYELEETTEDNSGEDLVRPADYDEDDNPRAWVLKYKYRIDELSAEGIIFKIDKIQAKYLLEGKDPVGIITATVPAETNNGQTFDKKFIIGSIADVITIKTHTQRDPWRKPRGLNTADPIISYAVNILSSDLIYTGWLRSSADVPYDTWTRDGVGESDKLHNIWNKTAASQYNKSWRMLRASLTSKTTTFSPINSYREVNDDNRIYLPMNGTLNDRMNTFSLELCEIGFGDDLDIGSDGTTTAPFTSGFTIGFGSDYN